MSRRLLTLASLLPAVLIWQGCNTHAVEPFAENIVAEQTDKVGTVGSNKVDILWIVDNSGSMCEEQAQLRQNFDLFIDQIIEIGVDFRLAVITTDMMDPVESGRFQNVPDGTPGPACSITVDISSCPSQNGQDPAPLVIKADDPRYRNEDGSLNGDLLKRDFGCNATTGTRGNGFEMGLEAARTALSPSLLDGYNSGFIRDDAFLAVIFLTDENDCSDRGALDKTNGNICEWEADKLVPETDYIDFFQNLKPNADQLILAGIIAPDAGLRYEYGDEVLPSCTSGLGEGYAGYRYENVIRAFTQSESGVSNICKENAFEAALAAIGRLIVEALDTKCLDAPPVTCDSEADCNGAACAPRNRSTNKFCEAFRVQVEITRPLSAGALDGHDCEQLRGSETLRCVLNAGDDYSVVYGDTKCAASGISVDLTYKLAAGDELGVRYPRAVIIDEAPAEEPN